ncbi:unnamed protein product [Ectocarpus sp. CCAP 1310/34]|nr:unnamed protein product [Ectocarpus sp. CCAP 1310/34]
MMPSIFSVNFFSSLVLTTAIDDGPRRSSMAVERTRLEKMVTEEMEGIMDTLSRLVPGAPPAGSASAAGGGGGGHWGGRTPSLARVSWTKRRIPNEGSREREGCEARNHESLRHPRGLSRGKESAERSKLHDILSARMPGYHALNSWTLTETKRTGSCFETISLRRCRLVEWVVP